MVILGKKSWPWLYLLVPAYLHDHLQDFRLAVDYGTRLAIGRQRHKLGQEHHSSMEHLQLLQSESHQMWEEMITSQSGQPIATFTLRRVIPSSPL